MAGTIAPSSTAIGSSRRLYKGTNLARISYNPKRVQLYRACVRADSCVHDQAMFIAYDDQINTNKSTPYPSPLDPIPIIDISLLSSATNEAQHELHKLKQALTSWGCFQAIGHGISSSVLEEVRETTRSFFALPMEEKHKYDRKPNSLEGYGEDPNVHRKVIFKYQSERLMLQVAPRHERKLHLWPNKPSNLREILDKYSTILLGHSRSIVKAMARSLNLEEDSFLQQYGNVEDELVGVRFNYYPATSKSSDMVEGNEAHSDGSGITIVLQDQEVEGLQVLKDGHWYRVPIIPDALFVNVGDQLQIIMSNGIFKSPTHRVLMEPKQERISVVMFHLPRYEVEIGPIQSLINENRPQQYIYLKNYRQVYFDTLHEGKLPLEKVKLNSPHR